MWRGLARQRVGCVRADQRPGRSADHADHRLDECECPHDARRPHDDEEEDDDAGQNDEAQNDEAPDGHVSPLAAQEPAPQSARAFACLSDE